MTRPADEFVKELVGSGNLLRRLSLLKVRSVLEARERWASDAALSDLQATSQAVVSEDEDLRSVLSKLLESGAQAMHVVDTNNQMVGEIRFDDLRAALVEYAPKPERQV